MSNQTNATQAQITLIGEGTVFEGKLQVEDDVRAHGRVIGTLQVGGTAMIAEQGAVEGDIVAADAEVAGQVEGEIQAEERLVLKSTARVDGKIEAGQLVIEEGAQFTGECEMGTPIPAGEGAASDKVRGNGEMPHTERESGSSEEAGFEEVAAA